MKNVHIPIKNMVKQRVKNIILILWCKDCFFSPSRYPVRAYQNVYSLSDTRLEYQYRKQFVWNILKTTHQGQIICFHHEN